MRGVPFSGERSLRLSPFIVSTSRGSQIIQSTPAPAPPRGGRGARIELTSRRTPAPARERSRWDRRARSPGPAQAEVAGQGRSTQCRELPRTRLHDMRCGALLRLYGVWGKPEIRTFNPNRKALAEVRGPWQDLSHVVWRGAEASASLAPRPTHAILTRLNPPTAHWRLGLNPPTAHWRLGAPCLWADRQIGRSADRQWPTKLCPSFPVRSAAAPAVRPQHGSSRLLPVPRSAIGHHGSVPRPSSSRASSRARLLDWATADGSGGRKRLGLFNVGSVLGARASPPLAAPSRAHESCRRREGDAPLRGVR